MNPYVLLALAYVAGATPTSHVVGKGVYGTDLRTKGSGNLGGTNTFRVLGWKAALPVVVVDVFKGWLPVWYFPQLHGDRPWEWALAYGGAAIVGHVFSFWVGFKGGKGIATSGGVFLAVVPLALLAGVATWFVVVVVTRIVSVGSMAAALVVPVAVYFSPHAGGDATLWFTVGLAAFVIWSHRSNIDRLMKGEESSFRKPTTGSSGPAWDDKEGGALE